MHRKRGVAGVATNTSVHMSARKGCLPIVPGAHGRLLQTPSPVAVQQECRRRQERVYTARPHCAFPAHPDGRASMPDLHLHQAAQGAARCTLFRGKGRRMHCLTKNDACREGARTASEAVPCHRAQPGRPVLFLPHDDACGEGARIPRPALAGPGPGRGPSPS
eukprot:25410-Chlamydomonas_euryale.AAC.3